MTAPTSQADTASFQSSAYFPADSPTDANNPFGFVSMISQQSGLQANSEKMSEILSNPSKELQPHTHQEMQPLSTQDELFMPHGPPLPSQGSLNPFGAQALAPFPSTHGALESHHSQEPLPSQTPLASQGSQLIS